MDNLESFQLSIDFPFLKKLEKPSEPSGPLLLLANGPVQYRNSVEDQDFIYFAAAVTKIGFERMTLAFRDVCLAPRPGLLINEISIVESFRILLTNIRR